MEEKRTAFALLLILCLVISIFPVVSAADEFWTTLEPMPTPRTELGVAVVDGKIYAIGGYNGSYYSEYGSYLGTNEMYDPATDTWTTKASMHKPRSNFAIAVIDTKIFVFFGMLSEYQPTSTFEIYDTITDTWEIKKCGLYTGSDMSAEVVNGSIYLVGGLISPWPPSALLGKIQSYNFATESLETEAQIPNPVFAHGSAFVDGKIFMIGGRDIGWDIDPENISHHYDLTQIYDTKTGTWSNGKKIPQPIHGVSIGVTSGVSALKRIHLLKEDIHYVYDPENDFWTNSTPMLTPRYGAGVAVVNDLLYVIGGYGGRKYRTENEMYTPAGYIPEFPSWAILPLLIVATLVGVTIRNKIRKKGLE